MDGGATRAAPDVVVVGGGIVGCAAAAFLAEGGAHVVLVEREGIAAAASGANSGVVQHPFDPVLAALYHETIDLYRELTAADAGFRLAARPAGMLFVSEREAAARAAASDLATTFPGLETAVVGGTELQRLEPAVGPGLWACRVDIGYPVAPGASTYAYATLAERHGVEIRVGREAALALEGDRVVGVLVDGRRIAAGAVVAAAGPGTPALVDPTGRWRPIRPLWGVVVEADLPVTPVHVLEEAGIDATIGVPAGGTGGEAAAGPATDDGLPAADGAAADDPHRSEVDFSIVPQPVASAVGSTFLEVEPDPAAWVERLLTGATRFVPSVADAPIRGTRACARPQSADGLPLVGPVPGRRDLFVCSGHGPWGISTGPASARLVADLVLGRAPAIPPKLDPARFGAVE